MASFSIASAGVTVDGSSTDDRFNIVTGASAVTVNGLAGDDVVNISASAASIGDSLFALSDGDDTFDVTTANSTGFDYVSATIRGGAGEDTINVGFFSAEVNNVSIAGNEGDDTIELNITAMDGTASAITVLGGASSDTITIDSEGDLADSYIGGGSDADIIRIVSGQFTDSTMIGGFGQDTASMDADVGSSLIQLGNGTNDSTDSADTLTFSGQLDNSTLKGGAGGDTLELELEDNSTATIIEGNAGNDTINLDAEGDYESTEFRLGGGDDTINFSGVNGAVSADIFGGKGDDTINIELATGIMVEGGEGADASEWSNGQATYRLNFGDSTESDFDTIGSDAIATGGTVDFRIAGSDIAIKTAETVTTAVDGTDYTLAFSGGTVFFGTTGINDITAAVDFMEAALGEDQAAVFSFTTGRLASGGAEFYLFVKGNDDETSLVAEMTNAGAGLTQTGGYALTEANTFNGTDLTFTV